MKIAIDTSPLDPNSGHSVRGVGSYLRSIVENIEKFDRKNEYIFFSDRKIPVASDIVHIPYFDPFRFEIPLKNIKKLVITIHDLTPVLFPQHFPAGIKGTLIWKFQKIILKNAVGIITDSHSSARDIRTLIGIPESNIFPVHLAGNKNYFVINDEKKIRMVLDKYHLPEKFALYVGDVTWNKNLPFIIESCIDAGVPLVLVGKAISDKNFDESNPWNKDRIIVQKHLSLNSGLLYALGFVEDADLNCIYNAAQVLVMPSKYEGFGLPVLEAMQAGCPVITSKTGSLEEVGEDAVIYINHEDMREAAEVLKQIFKDSNKRQELRKKGIAQSKKFTIERMINETVVAYEKIFNKA